MADRLDDQYMREAAAEQREERRKELAKLGPVLKDAARKQISDYLADTCRFKKQDITTCIEDIEHGAFEACVDSLKSPVASALIKEVISIALTPYIPNKTFRKTAIEATLTIVEAAVKTFIAPMFKDEGPKSTVNVASRSDVAPAKTR